MKDNFIDGILDLIKIKQSEKYVKRSPNLLGGYGHSFGCILAYPQNIHNSILASSS